MEDIDFTQDKILTDDNLLPWELVRERPSLFSLITVDGFLRSSAYPWSTRVKDMSCLLFSGECLEEECGTTRCACCGVQLQPFNMEFCSTCEEYQRIDAETQWIRESMRDSILRA